MAPSPATQYPYPATGSFLYQTGSSTKNRTGVGLSTMIIIKVDDTRVGAIQTLSVNESRTITMVSEVGTDGHIDSAPTKSAEHSATCQRLRFDRVRATQAFGAGFMHVKSQRIPFDIEIIDQFNGEVGSGSEIVTALCNCWFESIKYDYGSDNWLVTDDLSIKFETIYSRIGSNPAVTGGERNIPLRYDPYELAADMGNRRGSMDAPGLITASFLAA
jgi:hypothetical protein